MAHAVVNARLYRSQCRIAYKCVSFCEGRLVVGLSSFSEFYLTFYINFGVVLSCNTRGLNDAHLKNVSLSQKAPSGFTNSRWHSRWSKLEYAAVKQHGIDGTKIHPKTTLRLFC